MDILITFLLISSLGLCTPKAHYQETDEQTHASSSQRWQMAILSLQKCEMLGPNSTSRHWLPTVHTVFAERICRTAGYLRRHLCCHVGAATTFLLSAGASVAQTLASLQQQGCLAASRTAGILVCLTSALNSVCNITHGASDAHRRFLPKHCSMSSRYSMVPQLERHEPSTTARKAHARLDYNCTAWDALACPVSLCKASSGRLQASQASLTAGLWPEPVGGVM